jgi:alpha-amylase/alpha-mannosidase (GH57 family)
MIQTQPVSTIDAQGIDPLKVASGVYVTVHGHFYQPPRENPYLDAIERQPSAHPFHDWNERVHHECYRPNAFARILSDRGEVVEIVNNFEYLSFNIGPTLMSWLERHDVEVYQRILEADRKSCDRLNGHGNAIAQVYNHIIMPLANAQDKETQIRWGIEDFRSRFGRDPEGMWLAETAVDYLTLKALVDAGIRFIILAPSQAQRCRPIPAHTSDDPDWIEVGGSQIDPIQPYRCFLPGGNVESDFIDIFFYDGPISRDMGFNDVMASSQHFAGRIGQAVRGDHRTAQLISVATDGETFGHHKGGSEKALAYALTREFAHQGWIVTNYAHYLSLNPPTWEVELKPVTAWSCSHGVDRWQDDCGCGGGGLWHQQWRRPLRDALDWLRDHLAHLFEESGRQLFIDPWAARNDYIQVVRDRSPAQLKRFWQQHQNHPLTANEKVDGLRLLEMQRHSLLMYTSCGWFFDELSRPEGVQILRYAARAIELAGDVAGVQLETEFIEKLVAAPSNVDTFKNGADVYRQLVVSSRISIGQVAAHYAISSLFTSYAREQRVYCYVVHQLDYQTQRIGSLKLAVGQIQLTSEMTRERSHLVFAVLHLGGWDFHCCIQPFAGRSDYAQTKEKLFHELGQASAAPMILAMIHTLGNQSYSLHDLFAEERHRIMRLLSRETLTRLDQLYTQVYRDNYGVLMAFHRDHLDVPQELQVAAEVAISHRAILSLRSLERETSDLSAANFESCLNHLEELDAIATEADSLHCQLKLPQAKQTLERLILRSLWQLLHAFNPDLSEQQIHWIGRLITVGDRLHLGLSLDRAQELYIKNFYENVLPQLLAWKSREIGADFDPNASAELHQLHQILTLGEMLIIDVNQWLEHLGHR